MFQYFFILPKSKNLLKFSKKKRFFGVWNDSCQYPKFLGCAKIRKLPILPKMSKWSKSILDFFLLISIKNMTFYGSHATQEQKMSKMFRRDHKSNFLHLIEIWPPLSGPFSCLIIIKKYSEPVQREIFVMRSLSCFNE